MKMMQNKNMHIFGDDNEEALYEEQSSNAEGSIFFSDRVAADKPRARKEETNTSYKANANSKKRTYGYAPREEKKSSGNIFYCDGDDLRDYQDVKHENKVKQPIAQQRNVMHKVDNRETVQKPPEFSKEQNRNFAQQVTILVLIILCIVFICRKNYAFSAVVSLVIIMWILNFFTAKRGKDNKKSD